ncbi:pentapeptide repeat-containing protein [Leptolyngbya sp. PCC 6406]|uniref:pentapeptide repeat-containing protein n=1 Tax=Leptolyngbya sp. PCC 6406 TaxID=1173264 RepID=UPI0002AC5C4E|nr:pentapeptide repeat-containing protein [Leptolyngbya sp. PCC 6406]
MSKPKEKKIWDLVADGKLTGVESPHLSKEALISDERVNFYREDWRGFSFDSLEIRDVDFSGSKLQGASFKDTQLFNVNMNDCETGITNITSIWLRILAFFLAAVSGMIGTYCTAYFIFIAIDSLNHELGSPAAIVIIVCFILLLIFSIFWSFIWGLGKHFLGFLLFVVFANFCIQIFFPDDLANFAAISLISLSCFVGIFSSFLMQSQAIYINREIVAFKVSRNKNAFGLIIEFVIYGFAGLGIVFGFILAGESEYESSLTHLLTFALSIAWIISGSFLGLEARKEKQQTANFVGSDFLEYADEGKFSPLFRGDLHTKDSGFLVDKFSQFIQQFKTARRKRLKQEKYGAVRAVFDAVIGNFKTSFLNSSLTNVTFSRTKLDKTLFQPSKIEVLIVSDKNREDFNEVEESAVESIKAAGNDGRNNIIVIGDNAVVTTTGSTKGNVMIDSGGKQVFQRNISVGNISNSVVNIDAIASNVANSINKIPDDANTNSGEVKELLRQLQELLMDEQDLLPQEDKVEALEQVEVLAEVAQQPEDDNRKRLAKRAVKLIRGTIASVEPATQFVANVGKLVTEISTLLGLVSL